MTTSRWQRVASALTPAEWRRAGALGFAVVGLHVVGFGTLLLLVIPRHFSLGHGSVFGLGLGITAYTLGLRHALDADHIAAIDNTTRKLMAEGKRPLGVGFSFSLGHSTVVFALALLLALGVHELGPQVQHPGSALHQLTGVVGASVSGVFLYLIGAVNLAILIDLVRAFLGLRGGSALDEARIEQQLASRGLINRIVAPLSARVRSSWHMYPLGILFGLGFDTATEVGLLFLAAGAASSGLPAYAILCLPVLFAAGMSLLDTIDGSFMNFAYGWAFSKPVRKLYYNLTVTGLSVMVAFMVGSIELLSTLSAKLGLHWTWLEEVNLNAIGYVIVALFVITWVLALAVWRLARIEERWASRTLVAPASNHLVLE